MIQDAETLTPGCSFAPAHIPLGLAVLHPDSYAVVRRLIEAAPTSSAEGIMRIWLSSIGRVASRYARLRSPAAK
jgi:hypothetical protein